MIHLSLVAKFWHKNSFMFVAVKKNAALIKLSILATFICQWPEFCDEQEMFPVTEADYVYIYRKFRKDIIRRLWSYNNHLKNCTKYINSNNVNYFHCKFALVKVKYIRIGNKRVRGRSLTKWKKSICTLEQLASSMEISWTFRIRPCNQVLGSSIDLELAWYFECRLYCLYI